MIRVRSAGIPLATLATLAPEPGPASARELDAAELRLGHDTVRSAATSPSLRGARRTSLPRGLDPHACLALEVAAERLCTSSDPVVREAMAETKRLLELSAHVERMRRTLVAA